MIEYIATVRNGVVKSIKKGVYDESDLGPNHVKAYAGVKLGMRYNPNKGTFGGAPGNLPEDPPTSKRLSPVDFKMLFTPMERVAIKQSSDPYVQDFLDILNDPNLTGVRNDHPSTTAGLAHMVSLGLLTEERKNEILDSF